MRNRSEQLHPSAGSKILRAVGLTAIVCAGGVGLAYKLSSGEHNQAQVAAQTGAASPDVDVTSDVQTDNSMSEDFKNMEAPLAIGAGVLGVTWVTASIGMALANRREHDFPSPSTESE